ncbi:copper resistance CopC/CopD family protein [Tengunoibacter tsumagoiensis]|uniref:CopC domain-containing protein n=1 Tax=Tengunoibacter tsumagoiensis TaxID=2014871 RepID=A0A402A5A4_9CHLR|nr:copper resistance protein CopC [Tengunoibacter tsumagoiensis]GCE14333.1 hypothetical protein KTT_41920 [Tengunoibacter tsumagoiensis]
MQQRRLPVTIIALLLSVGVYICSLLLGQPPVAQAHAFVIGSDPVDGSTIQALPAEIHIYFNAPISSLSSAQVLSIQAGKLTDIGSATSLVASNNPNELITPVKTLASQPQGSYEILWTAVASGDGRTTYGIIGFNVGFANTGASGTVLLGPTSSNNLTDIRAFNPINIMAVFWDWLGLASLTAWLGLLLIELLLLSDKGRSQALLIYAKKRTYSLQWLCLGLLLSSDLISLFLREVQLSQALKSDFSFSQLLTIVFETSYGQLLLARTVLLILAMGLLYWTGRPKSLPAGTEPSLQLKRTGSLHLALTQDGPTTHSTHAVNSKNLSRKTIDLKEFPSNPPQRISNSNPKGVGRQTIELKDTIGTPPSLRYTWVACVIALLTTLSYSLSRPAAQVLQPQISAIVFDWLYLIGQAIWIGGMAYLGIILLPLFVNTMMDNQAETQITLLRRLRPFFLVGIGMLTISGLYLCNASITQSQQLLSDPYGRTVLVQIGLVVIMLALSFYALFVHAPRLSRQARLLPFVDSQLPTRRSREAALQTRRKNLRVCANSIAITGAGVLLCCALLSFFAPPIVFPSVSYHTDTPAQNTSKQAQTKQLGDLSLTLQLLPGKVGSSNTVLLLLTDSSGKALTDATIHLAANMTTMDMGVGEATMMGGNPIYLATFDKQAAFSMSGLWNLQVDIQRPDQAPQQTSFEIMLDS